MGEQRCLYTVEYPIWNYFSQIVPFYGDVTFGRDIPLHSGPDDAMQGVSGTVGILSEVRRKHGHGIEILWDENEYFFVWHGKTVFLRVFGEKSARHL